MGVSTIAKKRPKYSNVPFIYRISTVYLPCINRISTVFDKAKVRNEKLGLDSEFQSIKNKIRKK
jgi:hypothetical protein